MAFLKFPNQQYVRVLNSDQNTRLGYFNLQDATEIKHIMVTLFQRGVIVSPYSIRIRIYGNDDLESAIFSSDWATLSTSTLIDNETGLPYTRNWIGNIYVDLDGYPLNTTLNYYFSVETDGYTRVGDTFYLGVNLDWYSPVNNQLDGPNEAGARIRILGKR